MGIAEQWLILVLMPVVAAAALGAVGGLLGQWLRARRESPAKVDLRASPGQGG